MFTLEVQDFADAGTETSCRDADTGEILLSLQVPCNCAGGRHDLDIRWQRANVKVLLCEWRVSEFCLVNGRSTSESECDDRVGHVTGPRDAFPQSRTALKAWSQVDVLEEANRPSYGDGRFDPMSTVVPICCVESQCHEK